jgi:hypothetical protein
MSTDKYTNRIPSYERAFIQAEKQPYKHVSKEVYPKANPIYKNAVQYYDSPVQNSMIYPNMYLIKPVNYDFVPVDQSKYLDDSIKQNQKFAFGPYVIQNRQVKLWS